MQACFEDEALIFTQAKCFEDDSWQALKRRVTLAFTCLGLFFSLWFMFVFLYRMQVNKLDFSLWDLKTVTIDDFTVEASLSIELWEHF